MHSCFKFTTETNEYLELTVKPVLTGHLWDREKWSFKTDDLLKQVQHLLNHEKVVLQNICPFKRSEIPIKCSMTGQEKSDCLNRGINYL
jgi:hypothetical protein